MPLRPPVGQMLVSQVEKSSITSGPHGPPVDELLLLLLVVVAPLLLLLLLVVLLVLVAVALLLGLLPPVAWCPPVPIEPPAPLLVPALELAVGADPSRLMQTESTHERPERQVLPDAHGHLS
jgi:hypothetical protein